MVFQFQQNGLSVELNSLNWENLKDRSIKSVQQINEMLHDTK